MPHSRKKPITPNALMKHLRANGVAINGSSQKRKLRNMGYYHGYKGYRFVGRAANRLPITDFNQIITVYNFDTQVKTLMYPWVMGVETALKNRTLEAVLDDAGSVYFEDIWKKSLTDYRNAPSRGRYSEAWDKRQRLRGEIDSLIFRNRKEKDVIAHFKEKDEEIPIWAIFEVMTLGNFGAFYLCLDQRVKTSIVRDLGMPTNLDSAHILGSIIFAMKDLRNAIAHNSTVYDVRFKTSRTYRMVSRLFESEMNLSWVDLTDITDYVVLLVYLLKRLGFSKTDCNRVIDDYRRALDRFKADAPQDVYDAIIGRKVPHELARLRDYVKGV